MKIFGRKVKKTKPIEANIYVELLYPEWIGSGDVLEVSFPAEEIRKLGGQRVRVAGVIVTGIEP